MATRSAGVRSRTRPQVKREMDTFHKVSAIRLLFAAPDDGAAVQEEAA
jgi:hypothetical protein